MPIEEIARSGTLKITSEDGIYIGSLSYVISYSKGRSEANLKKRITSALPEDDSRNLYIEDVFKNGEYMHSIVPELRMPIPKKIVKDIRSIPEEKLGEVDRMLLGMAAGEELFEKIGMPLTNKVEMVQRNYKLPDEVSIALQKASEHQGTIKEVVGKYL